VVEHVPRLYKALGLNSVPQINKKKNVETKRDSICLFSWVREDSQSQGREPGPPF
jgi:hypothetical protein